MSIVLAAKRGRPEKGESAKKPAAVKKVAQGDEETEDESGDDEGLEQSQNKAAHGKPVWHDDDDDELEVDIASSDR